MKYFFANWKMYLDVVESCSEAAQLRTQVKARPQLTMAVFPNTLAFAAVETVLHDTPIALGAQNVAWTPKGAYTGAVSAYLFAQAGAEYALVGHSECRHIFGESDDDVRKKFLACFESGLTPVLCIGETQADADAGKRQYRLKKQLLTALQNVDLSRKKFLVAYEPVWAIGSGQPCSPADVEDVHGWLRLELTKYTSAPIPLLYGGSVDKNNVRTYTKLSCVDGVIVGSASTKADSFVSLASSIVQAV